MRLVSGDREGHHVGRVAGHEASGKPSWMPSTSTAPERQARMVAAPITLLMPGAGPPATTMASFCADEAWGRGQRPAILPRPGRERA